MLAAPEPTPRPRPPPRSAAAAALSRRSTALQVNVHLPARPARRPSSGGSTAPPASSARCRSLFLPGHQHRQAGGAAARSPSWGRCCSSSSARIGWSAPGAGRCCRASSPCRCSTPSSRPPRHRRSPAGADGHEGSCRAQAGLSDWPGNDGCQPRDRPPRAAQPAQPAPLLEPGRGHRHDDRPRGMAASSGGAEPSVFFFAMGGPHRRGRAGQLARGKKLGSRRLEQAPPPAGAGGAGPGPGPRRPAERHHGGLAHVARPARGRVPARQHGRRPPRGRPCRRPGSDDLRLPRADASP